MGKRVDAALKVASDGMPPLGFSDEEWYEAKADALMKLAEELEAELDARADVQGGWISVNDSMPDDWVPVLVYVPERRLGVKAEGQCYAVAHRYGGSETYGPPGWTVASNLWGGFTKAEPTHWMPLPNPPSNSALPPRSD